MTHHSKREPWYSEDGITIFNGDSREIIPELRINFDLCLTDFPYGINLDYGTTYKDTRSNLKTLISTLLPKIRLYSRVALLTPGISQMYLYPEPDWILGWFYPGGSYRVPWGFNCWQPVLCYGRDQHLAKGLGCLPDAIIINSPANLTDTDHSCPKPLKFWTWLIKRGCIKEKAIILDPLMGSGTTLLVARALQYRAIGIEINKEYCKTAVDRLKQIPLWRTESEDEKQEETGLLFT